MICPHCLKNIHLRETTGPFIGPGVARVELVIDDEHDPICQWLITSICPACYRLIVSISSGLPTRRINRDQPQSGVIKYPDPDTEDRRIIWPRGGGRKPAPQEIPDEFKRDYQDACTILNDSPNASAALSRRCLQHLLRKQVGAQGANLYQEITWAIENGNLPSSIIRLLDVPRKVGNQAAHPTSDNIGEIVDVQPWEATWCLEIIEALYDYLFVLPANNQERLERLEKETMSESNPHAVLRNE